MSKYFYPGTNVLINLPGIRDPDKLNQFERVHTYLRLVELQHNPIKGKFDFDHLKEIHRYIFQDVYPFAGQIRDENIAKDYFTFAPYPFIEKEANRLFDSLKDENFLSGLEIDPFSQRSAYYMAELNVLHPFREGNGRTIREFIRQLAYEAGYSLDWRKRDYREIFQASVRSKTDTKELAQVIRSCLTDLRQLDREIDRER